MFCKHCGKEIDDNAKFCNHCGKALAGSVSAVKAQKAEPKKKKKRHPILGTIVLIIGIFIIIGALGSSNEPQKVSSEKTPAATVAKETEPPVYTVGDTLEMGDVLVTLNGVTESTGSQFLTPADGNVFVICEFTIENNSNTEMAVSSLMSFECYFDDFAANISLGAMTGNHSKPQLDGTVAPGKKINGVVGYEAPSDWTEMEVHFKTSAYSAKSFIFNYSK